MAGLSNRRLPWENPPRCRRNAEIARRSSLAGRSVRFTGTICDASNWFAARNAVLILFIVGDLK
jgi:hypothetical protein